MRASPKTVMAVLVALLVWLGLGFSLGWYYTFTYYGRLGWPMPLIEACGAIILYYFSVLNVDTELQAVHWMLVFPAAGMLWAATLRATAPWMGLERPQWNHVVLAVALAALPMAIPGPWMAWLAASKYGEVSWETMMRIALRRDGYSPWPALSPFYFALGLAGLGLELTVYGKVFRASLRKGAIHLTASAIVFVIACCVSGAVLAWPMRMWLE